MLLEVKKIIKMREYKIIFFVMYIAMLLDFLIMCSITYGSNLSEVVSANYMNLFYNISRSSFRIPFTLLLPVCIGFMGCSSYEQDRKNRMNNYIITRTSRKNYIIKKAVSIFVVAAFTVLLLHTLNMILAIIAFPVYGYRLYTGDLYSLFAYYGDERLLGHVEYTNPYLGLCFFMLFRMLFAGILGIQAYGISMFIKNKYIIIFSPFIVSNVIAYVAYFAENKGFNYCPIFMNTFVLYPRVNFIMYVLPYVFNFIFAIILIKCGIKRDEI